VVFAFIMAMLFSAFVNSVSARPVLPLLTVEVLEVQSSPGLWSGIAEMDQWFVGIVKSSSDSRFPVGDRVKIGVPLVKGNSLFDPTTPQFSTSKISPGQLISIRISSDCIQEAGPRSFKSDPTCIRSIRR
jgi:hypothetical protein